MSEKILAFTLAYNGIVNVLVSDIGITQAFDPADPSNKVVATNPNPHKFKAVWDTGATNTVVNAKVAQTLELQPIGMVITRTANGKRHTNAYLANIYLPSGVAFSNVRVTEGTIEGNADMLVGMDIIGSGDFAVTKKNGHTCFSYRYPCSSQCIDFVEQNRLSTQVNKPKVGRNDPCPCGSGKKYKKCCGLTN